MSALTSFVSAVIAGNVDQMGAQARRNHLLKFLLTTGVTVTSVSGLAAFIIKKYSKKPLAKPKVEEHKSATEKVAVDKIFFKKLNVILRICIKSWKSKTIFILVLHSTFLILRTYLSLAVARLDGKIVKDLVIFTFYFIYFYAVDCR